MARYHSARVLVQWVVGAVLLGLVLRTWVIMGFVQPVVVAGSSMTPTMCAGERLWIDRTAFQRRQPRRWEVVVARAPHDGAELCVKRVVGLPGELVELRGGKLWIDGDVMINPVELPRTLAQSWTARQLGPFHLRASEYFLLGDNGVVSLDSRAWGPVSERLLLGKPLGVR